MFLLRASQVIEKEFEIKVAFRRMIEELATVETLAAHLDQEMPMLELPASPEEILEALPAEAMDEPGEPADLEASASAEEALLLDPAPSSEPAEPVAAFEPASSLEAVPALETTPLPEAAAPPEPVAPPEPGVPPSQPLPPAAGAPAKTGLEWILRQQLQVMSRQLELMRRSGAAQTTQTGPRPVAAPVAKASASPAPPPATPAPHPATPAQKAPTPAAPAAAPPATPPTKASADDDAPKRKTFIPFKPLTPHVEDELTPRQRKHLEELIERIVRRTGGSKELTQKYRLALANNRAIAGFRQLWKEMFYPLAGRRGEGSRIWDVDGNEYVDLTMGFGSLLFGHSPPFIKQALQRQLDLGIQVGPESETAGEVAKLISELTGAERVTFTNSGTEAVMSAIRLARMASGREKIAVFAGSYHGTYDGVLASGIPGKDGRLESIPMAPGVPQHMAENIIMLDFDSSDCLAVVEEHASDLAAVLVEPRQSRRPQLETRELLTSLRQLTERLDIALIYDEVVTGFRLHPGGVQALTGVRADITTYGKAVANGMPIGVVAGKAKYLDAIDGGMWSYGDDSRPTAEITFFAGTFFRHPLVMASALAVLRHLKEQGPELQENLARRTARFCAQLNEVFEEAEAPVQVVHLGSLFRFAYSPELRYMDLFFYYLLDHGVYVWERRVCYFSPSHTDEDIEQVIQAVRHSVREMQEGGFLPSPAGDPAEVPSESPEAEARDLPLTEAQKEVWAVAQFGPEASAAYNLATVLRLRGELNKDALGRAFQTVVSRHEALRTTIDPVGESQQIAARTPIEIHESDLSETADPDVALEQLRRREARHAFDLSEGPLLRVRLVKLKDDDHVLLVTIHHIVADGQSQGIIFGEMAAFYTAECRGRELSLPPTRQFSDYVAHLGRLEQRGQTDTETFWLERFTQPLPVLELPADRPRPAIQSYAGDRRATALDADTLADLRDLARRQGSTLNMLLLAGVKLLLHRLSSQNDLVVGLPAAGQSLVGAPLVGYCLNVLPIRTRSADTMSVADYLKSVRGGMLDAYEHQGYPVSRLVRKLGLHTDASRPPLFSVIFNMDRTGGALPEFAGLEVEFLPNPTYAVQFDLHWNLTETDDDLDVQVSYNADLFDPTTVERWLGHLRNLLQATVADPECWVGELPLLAPSQRQKLLAEWNDTATPEVRGDCVHHLFKTWSERTPDAPAVVFESEALSYRELDRRANLLAATLRASGVGPETRVGIYVERSLEMVVGILGVLKAGGAYVPLDLTFPAQRLKGNLEDADARMLLVKGSRPADLDLGELPQIDLDAPRPEAVRGGQAAAESTGGAAPGRGNLAYLIYTSGSTGRPKGVAIEHRQLLAYVEGVASRLDLPDGTSFATVSTLAADLGNTAIFTSLCRGGCLHVISGERVIAPLPMAEYVASRRLQALKIVPSHLEALMTASEAARVLPTERLVLGGEALSQQLLARVTDLAPDCQVFNHYGPTEATVGVLAQRAVPSEQASGGQTVPLGRPFHRVRAHVLDERLNPVPLGVAGELCLGGAILARGYLGRPDETASRFVPDPLGTDGERLYRTGDLARHRASGVVEFLGRIDDQLKIHGYRIEPGEIEALLHQHPDVRDAVVVAHSDDADRTQLVAHLVPEATAPKSSELRQYLKDRLPHYMVPSFFVFLEAIPLTANGKVDRAALARGAAAASESRESERAKSFAPPVTSVEKLLAKLWSAALRLDRVGVNDNFFELGGDSIVGIQIVARANQEGVTLSPAQVFQHQTIAELAAVAEVDTGPHAEQGPVSGPVHLIPSQRWFFSQGLAAPHHWNMAFLRRVERRISPAALEQAVRHLLLHHDALRLRFTADGSSAWQLSPAEEAAAPVHWLDLSALGSEHRSGAVERAAAQIQTSLDPSNGPLLRLALFDFGSDEPGRLFTVIHHLVIDLYSSQILVQDLMNGLRQAQSGWPIQLPEKTTSFQYWAQRLENLAQSESLHREVDYWTSGRDSVAGLPIDRPEGANTGASNRLLSVSLDPDETTQLQHKASETYRARLIELVLTALLLAYQRWTGGRGLAVDVEGHGREQLFDDVDLTRTVGWFTAIYPLLVEADPEAGPVATLKAVKERLRGVPNGGIGFGLLRHLTKDPEISGALQDLPPAQISFNFREAAIAGGAGTSTGGAGDSAPAGLFAPAGESEGSPFDPSDERPYLLAIDGGISGDRLEMHWNYSENLHRRSTIQEFADNFMSALRELIAGDSQERGLVPSDFPQARVSQEDLGKLMSKLGGG